MIRSHLFDVLNLVKTKSYAEEFLDRLDMLENSLFNKKIYLKDRMSELFTHEMKEKLITLAHEENVNLSDPTSVQKFLDSLKRYVRNLPLVTMVMAFEPNDRLVTEVSNWFSVNFQMNVLLNFVVDSSIIAGTIITCSGVQKDFSLRRAWEQKFDDRVLQNILTSQNQATIPKSPTQRPPISKTHSKKVN